MGLDAVEIVMEVEEVFDISLDDADVEKMVTPRDLIDAVLRKVAHTDVAGCLTQRAFNRLRKSLLAHLPLKRGDIVPSVPMADLVPKADREQLLAKLAADLGTGPWPDLVRPRWLVALIAWLSVAVGIGGVVVLQSQALGSEWGLLFVLGSIAAAVTAFLACLATAGFCLEFPPLTRTVGDGARWILAHKADLATPVAGRWTREQVAARVREIVIEQLGCASGYREEAHFVNDLGLS